MSSADEVIRRQTAIDPHRFDPAPGAPTMLAVVTTGNGGPDKLAYREVRRPRPEEGEVLVRVLAAGVNNTEINTRVGWYSASVAESTGRDAEAQGTEAVQREDGGWDAPTPFPFIQGTDCCGRVAEVGPGVDAGLVGRRVLDPPVHAPARLRVTAERLDGLRLRRRLRPVRARPGVGGLPGRERPERRRAWARSPAPTGPPRTCCGAPACARGSASSSPAPPAAWVPPPCSSRGCAAPRSRRSPAPTKRRRCWRSAPAASSTVTPTSPARSASGPSTWSSTTSRAPALTRSSRPCAPAGATSRRAPSPARSSRFDKRTFYLRDLTLIGCTAWDEPVFPALIGLLERGELRPPVAATWPLGRGSPRRRRRSSRSGTWASTCSCRRPPRPEPRSPRPDPPLAPRSRRDRRAPATRPGAARPAPATAPHPRRRRRASPAPPPRRRAWRGSGRSRPGRRPPASREPSP